MRKPFKIAAIVFISLALLVIAIQIGLYAFAQYVEKEDEKLVEQYENKTIEVLSADEMDRIFSIDDDFKSSIINCKSYYTATSIAYGTVLSGFASGHLTVTKEYYNKLLTEYDDWEVISTISQIDAGEYSEEEILEQADDNFKAFVQSEEFLFSQKMFNSEGRLYLLSQEKNEIYFFINRI